MKSIYAGKVKYMTLIDGVYFVLTKFGHYYIGYFGFIDPQIKVGDYLQSNHTLGWLGKDLNEKYSIEIYLMKGNIDIDPAN